MPDHVRNPGGAGTGRCTRMPAQETLDPSAAVASYPVVERDTGSSGSADGRSDRLPACGQTSRRAPLRDVRHERSPPSSTVPRGPRTRAQLRRGRQGRSPGRVPLGTSARGEPGDVRLRLPRHGGLRHDRLLPPRPGRRLRGTLLTGGPAPSRCICRRGDSGRPSAAKGRRRVAGRARPRRCNWRGGRAVW